MKRLIAFIMLVPIFCFAQQPAGEDAFNTRNYNEYEKPAMCKSCHNDLYFQWDQAMMSKAYTHHWDEIEYFKLAVPHAEKDEKVAGVKAGCNGCHAPIAFLSGDTPPPKPEENSRANESVSCDVCHTITGFAGDVPHNFNFMSSPGKTKYGPKRGIVSPYHNTEYSDFIQTAEFCGTCHNEKSPYGVWVKSTHLELKEGPYYQEGVVCQDCHVPQAIDKPAVMSSEETMVAQHLFHGAHVDGKLRGVIEMIIAPNTREAGPGETMILSLELFNQKTGHKFPTGSAEERVVWVHVEATDANGKIYHLPVDKKGFQGEAYTIASDTLAYQDLAIPLELENFKGIRRESVPIGDRIYRLPYLDPQGRQTIMQWNTASLGPDYRIGPRETKKEHYTFQIPGDAPIGKMTFKATMYYRKIPVPVQELLKVPAEESRAVMINDADTYVNIVDAYY